MRTLLLSSVLALAIAAPAAHAQDVSQLFVSTHDFSSIGNVLSSFDTQTTVRLSDAHTVQPTTDPVPHYSWLRHTVTLDGVLLGEGHPLPHTPVNVLVDLAGGFSQWTPVTTDDRGVYHVSVHAPARILSVHVDAASYCSTGDESDCHVLGDESESSAAGAVTNGPDSE